MYNWNYLKTEYDYQWIEDSLPLERTEHITFDPIRNDVKIYIRSTCDNFIYKLSKNHQVQRHLFYPCPFYKVDLDGLYRLISPSRRLLTLKFMAFDEGGKGYYFGVEDTNRRDFKALFYGLSDYTGLPVETLIRYANKINGLDCHTLDELYREKAIYMIRLGARKGGCKFYATPFAWQNPFILDQTSLLFLEKLYQLPRLSLSKKLISLAVSIEFETERLLITTQDIIER